MTDVLIIGAGTAGLTAAIYACRSGYSVLVMEEAYFGGQIINTPEIENYPAIGKISGADFGISLYNQAVEHGAKVLFEGVSSVDFSSSVKTITTGKNIYEAKTIIIANGAKRRKLGAKGEEEFSGRGVSYCATCDGAFYRDKATAIAGGGNTALEDALFLSNGCSEVHLIHRRDTFRGSAILVDSVLQRENIILHYDSVIEEIQGENNVQSIALKNVKTGEKTAVSVSGVFIAVGLVPDNARLAPQINLDAGGYIIAGEDCKTNIPGVYAAGDTRTKSLRQLVTAAGDGAVAAFEAGNYLNKTNTFKE